MKFSATQIGLLMSLCQGETIAASKLSKALADELCQEGLLTVRTHGSRQLYSAISTTSLVLYLQSHYDELRAIDLSAAANTPSPEQLAELSASRSAQAALTGNSKLAGVARSCPGFPVNSYEPLTCSLNGEPLTVAPADGTFLFITDWHSFAITEDVTVVGIENMENFRLIRRQRRLFESALPHRRLLFVSRYPQSADLRQWLIGISNPYVHFGDFDLAGINIFLTEFHRYLGQRSSFLIPADIDDRLAHGTHERYGAQLPRFRSLHTDIPTLQQLIDLIHHYRRGYDQEGYITTLP